MKTLFKHHKLAVFLSLFLISSLFSYLYAQKDSIKWGIEQEYLKQGFIVDLKILKTDSSSIYFYCYTNSDGDMAEENPSIIQKSNRLIIKHDRKTGLNKIYDINLKIKEYKLDFLNYFYIDSTFHFFTTHYNSKLNKLFIFHETFNLEKQQSNNDINKVAEIDLKLEKGSYLENMKMYYLKGRFLFRYSCNSKKGRFFGLEVFDKKTNKEWSNYSIALTETGVNYEGNYQLDNEGNVYATQRNFENEKDVNKHYDRSRIWAVCYPKGGGEPKSLALILKDDNFITSQQLSVNEKGEVVCAGLYARPGTTSAVGCFSFVIEPLLTKIKSVNIKEFSTEILTKGEDVKAKNNDINKIIAKKDFERDFGYNLNTINFRKDGSFDLVSEKYKLEIVKYYRDGSLQSVTFYHYFDDLLVLTYNSDGSIKWVQKIPKYEYVQNSGRLTGSYFLSYDKDDNMSFIFNLVNSDKTSKNAKTILIKLDKDGNESFKELEADGKIAHITCPQFFFKQEDNKIISTRYYYETILDRMLTKKNKLTFGELNIK